MGPKLKGTLLQRILFFEAHLAEEAGEVELAVGGVREHGVGLQQVLYNNHHIRKIAFFITKCNDNTVQCMDAS
jgi:hypothetical protein